MKAIHKIGLVVIFLVIIVTGIFWLKPGSALEKGFIIATAVPASVDLLNDDHGIDGRYILNSRIIVLNMNEEKDEQHMILTENFFSARSPEISFDGDFLVFSGQKSANDIWQIFTMDMHSLKITQVTDCPVNCTDPTWLPDGRIAFSRLNNDEKLGQIHVLHACEPNGTNMKRLMFHPNSGISPSVFKDGRILILSEQKYPETGPKQMLALRIDGTKSELFFGGDKNVIPVSRAREATNGQVYFIERRINNTEGGMLASISQGRPLHSYENLSITVEGDFYSVYPSLSGDLLVSFRQTNEHPYGLSTFKLENNTIGGQISYNNEFHIIEPVLFEEREVPMKLPAIVDESKGKGSLLCLNADLSMDSVDGKEKGTGKTDKVQIFGLEEMIGEVHVEKDGSFYIEIDADTPVRFQTVDANGEILRGPSSWIWVRPGEKRSCIGCHEDREITPDNKVPDALYAGMVSLPEGKRTGAIILKGSHKDNNEKDGT